MLAPEIAAAQQRLAERRAVAEDGVTLTTLRAALPRFTMRPAFKRSAGAAGVALEARRSIQQAIESLTDRLSHDAALIEQVAHPTPETLRTWSPDAFQQAQIDHLRSRVRSAAGFREILTKAVPRWEAEIMRRLQQATITPPPNEPTDEAPPARPTLFATSSMREA